MQFIDDIIESKLFSSLGKEPGHQADIPITRLVFLVAQELRELNDPHSNIDIRLAIARAVERHDHLRYEGDRVQAIGDTFWSPAHRAMVNLSTPIAGTKEQDKADAYLRAANQAAMKASKPDFQMASEGFTSTEVTDSLPMEITKTTEAWTWWLCQPNNRGKYWRTSHIVEGILAKTDRFTAGSLRATARAYGSVCESRGWPVLFKRQAGTPMQVGIPKEAESFTISVPAKSMPSDSKASPGTQATPPPAPPVEKLTRLEERMIPLLQLDENRQPAKWLFDPVKMVQPQQYKRALPPGRVAPEDSHLWDNTAHLITKHIKHFCFDQFTFWFYLNAIVELTPNLAFEHAQDQIKLLTDEIYDMGWTHACFTDPDKEIHKYGMEGPDEGIYVGPKELIAAKLTHRADLYFQEIDADQSA